MNKSISILMVAALFVTACNSQKKSVMSSALDKYAVVKIDKPDLSGITDNGKEVLNLYKFAAREADKIYWQQTFGDPAKLEGIADEATREYAKVNYGPWDRRNGKAFVEGYGAMPAGANYYPADMTAEEFDALKDPAKTSPYTVIRRDAEGKLSAVWYHDAYAENIETIVSCLKTAADITIKPSVRNYLLKKIEAIQTDDYYASELAWLDMTDSKMDLVLGPDEVTDDQLYGIKKSYEAFVLLKELEKTAQLEKYASKAAELQQALPCKDEYKTFVPGERSNIFACNALYYAGSANEGTKLVAINLPFDEKVQKEVGTRTILMDNIITAKFNKIIALAAINLLDGAEDAVDRESFFWNIAFREVAHGLGVKQTLDGRNVATALGNMAETIEEAKGDILGVYFATRLADSHELSLLSNRKSSIATFLVSIIRSGRFGNAEPIGRGNIICYNFLKEHGAFSRNPSGKYRIDYAKASEGIEVLSARLLEIQAKGDYNEAKAFVDKYSAIDKELEADFVNLRLEKIPIDLRFEYNW